MAGATRVRTPSPAAPCSVKMADAPVPGGTPPGMSAVCPIMPLPCPDDPRRAALADAAQVILEARTLPVSRENRNRRLTLCRFGEGRAPENRPPPDLGRPASSWRNPGRQTGLGIRVGWGLGFMDGPARGVSGLADRVRITVAGARRAAAGGRRWWRQFVLVAAFLWAVDATDKLHAGVEAAGLSHARTVGSISAYLGGGVSPPMNRWLAVHPLPAVAAAAYYIVLNVVVTGAVGLLLLRSRPRRFALHRNALITIGLVALVVFWVYPVAPPRMLPGYHDITATTVPVFAHLLEGRAADDFAALPSLHVAWALWVAVASQSLLRRPLWRAVVWIYPAVTVLDVLATANHYMLDVVSAPALVLLAYTLAALFERVRLLGARCLGRVAAAARRRAAWAGTHPARPGTRGGVPEIPRPRASPMARPAMAVSDDRGRSAGLSGWRSRRGCTRRRDRLATSPRGR